MDMVAIDGTVCGVLKEGVFFNKAYKDIRKCLIENFNVREVISVPQDQFENTSTKTSILIFDNLADKKTTSTVKFSEIVVERYEEDKFVMQNGFIYLIENKGDISKVTDKEVSSATREELLKNPICSLNGKDYNKKVIECGEGFKLVKLGDIVKFLEKSKRKAGEGKEDGQYNFYTSSDKIMKCDIADYTQEAIIIGTGGNSSIHLANMFSCSADNMIITSSKFNNNYIYYIVKSLWNLFISGMRGSTIKHVTKDMLINFNIPIPTTDQLIQQWVDKISKPFDEKNTKEKKLKTLELEIQNRIKEITENEDCDEAELGSLFEYIKTGKNKTPDNKNGKLYPYYGTAEITGYTDHYLFEGQHLLIARNGTMGNCFLVNGKFYPSDHIFVLKNKQTYNLVFLYYLIKSISSKIDYLSNGSTIKGISKDALSKIKISIPKDKTLITALEPKFLEIEKLQDDIKQAETLYKQYIDELAKSAIKQPIETQKEQTLETLPNEPSTTQETTIEITKPIVSSKPKVSITKKKSPKAKTTFDDILNKNTKDE
jgi:restriction endonuclease S subunit